MIELAKADVTRQAVDVIVNAANPDLAHGGGVAAAIARAGGPELCRESAGHPRVAVGEAAVTTAGALPARWVVHAVGPVWSGGGNGEPELLASAYRSALALAIDLGARSIAFPAISTGIFGYPVASAARIAIGALLDGAEEPCAPELIRVCLFSDSDLAAWQAALAAATAEAGRGG